MAKKTIAVPFATILAAMIESRDEAKRMNVEARGTTLSIDTDSDVELYSGIGSLVSVDSEPDEWGTRSYRLPVSTQWYTDEEIEIVAQHWVDGDFDGYDAFPPIEVTYDK